VVRVIRLPTPNPYSAPVEASSPDRTPEDSTEKKPTGAPPAPFGVYLFGCVFVGLGLLLLLVAVVRVVRDSTRPLLANLPDAAFGVLLMWAAALLFLARPSGRHVVTAAIVGAMALAALRAYTADVGSESQLSWGYLTWPVIALWYFYLKTNVVEYFQTLQRIHGAKHHAE
jgi:hypothetical protein